MNTNKKQELLDMIATEMINFNAFNYGYSIVQNSVPILWFGDVGKYFQSDPKIITVSLNPSDMEFKIKKSDPFSTKYRFPLYNNTIDTLYSSYNEYFSEQPYSIWFKASFDSVLESFSASHYSGASNIALHTDIGSPYATDPTWSGLCKQDRLTLENKGLASWHELVKILEPDVILFSASNNFESKIKFKQTVKWNEINVLANRPLLSGKFQIVPNKQTSVLFQIQGRKPFLQTSKDEKIKFSNHI